MTADEWGPDEPPEPPCLKCGSDMEWVECETCGGEGMWGHECGEDCCMCLDPDEDNVPCDICNGGGGWRLCVNRRKCEATEPGSVIEPSTRGGK